MPSRLFIFLQLLPTVSFFLLILSIFLISAFSLNSSTPLSFPTKTFYLSLISLSIPYQNHKNLSLKTLSYSPMAPKAKKTYMISGKVFNLTHWNGATRLTESLPLIFKPQNYLSEGAQTGLVSFSKFSHF